jgi:glycerophosphoryl diester phosphodiesterase
VSTFLLIAKAGGSSEAAENTCEAIERAVGLPASGEVEVGVEIDLRLSADGHLAALHDASLERTTNGRGLVRAYRLQELCQLTAGERGERVPSLPAVLEAAGAPSASRPP